MTAISTHFGSGGANLVPGRSGGEPTLAETLRDIADDLDALASGPAVANVEPLRDATEVDLLALQAAAVTDYQAITSDSVAVDGALAAFTDPPTAGEMAALRSLVNQLRTVILNLQALNDDSAVEDVVLTVDDVTLEDVSVSLLTSKA